MIITSQKALRIVSNPEILRSVPELLMPVEAYKVAERDYQAKVGCKKCQQSEFFSGVEVQALKAIQALSKPAIGRLKTFMGATELFLNLPNPGNKGSIVRLDQ